MPDLSLFKPLCDELGITLTEFINGEKISNNDLKEKSDLTLKNTIEYTNKKISKGKKIIILITITFSIIFLFLLVFLNYMYFTPCSYIDGDVSSWEKYFPSHSAYAMGLNKNNMPVFKNPSKALAKAKTDYSDAIKVLKKEFRLLPLTKYTYKAYKTYGWQIVSDNELVKKQGISLSSFFDIYENSYD